MAKLESTFKNMVLSLVIISMVAAFREQKDHATILKAMKHLPHNYHLQLIGEGETETKMKALCHDLGLDDTVSFLGNRTDVRNPDRWPPSGCGISPRL